MNYPRYPKYKDSGVDWLGEVPEGWGICRIKSLFEIKKRIAGELGHDILAITQKGIQVKDIDGDKGQFSMDYSKYQIVEPGDFAMNHMDLLTGYIDISRFNGVTSPDYRVFCLRRGNDQVPHYWLLVFQLCYHLKVFYALGQGSSQGESTKYSIKVANKSIYGRFPFRRNLPCATKYLFILWMPFRKFPIPAST